MTNELEVGLPPLQASRKAVWDYYRIEFLPSGYPGRRHDGELQAHPIYGPYVISDYVAQYRKTKDPVFLEAACKVADAAIGQMTAVKAGLVFMYDQAKTNVSSKKGVFYSGLTQSRYIEVLSKLMTLPGTERFSEPLHAVLASLTIPIKDGGVARWTRNGGLVIEEYPGAMPDLTLNGWTTATCIVMDFAKRNDDEQAREVFEKSVRGLEELVPLYDVPELANSRYRLTGPATFKLSAEDSDLEVFDCRIVIPGSGTYPANMEGDPAGKVLHGGPLAIRYGEAHTIAVSLSRLSWPDSNRLTMWIRSTQDGRLKLAIGEGAYDPLARAPRAKTYRDLQTVEVHKGWNIIDVEIPWRDAELIAYPTNFGKKITGRQFNQYHFIHIDTLGKIVAETGSEVLRQYHQKWEQYPTQWADIAEYQDERLMLDRFDAKKHK
ncbi:hypothetical protein GCM10009784_29120 [Arthrobacter parietis]|uniref:D-glucuronyl C5-epimerase C-terminal domain-containing protein n=2 Tax=Arthrobacter parietis TaxID=271434 RepID=A0ABN3B050_9MICC